MRIVEKLDLHDWTSQGLMGLDWKECTSREHELAFLYVLPNRESQKSQQEPINLMGGIGKEFQQQKKTCVVGRTPNFQNMYYLRSTYLTLPANWRNEINLTAQNFCTAFKSIPMYIDFHQDWPPLRAPKIYVVKNQSLHKIYYINLGGP